MTKMRAPMAWVTTDMEAGDEYKLEIPKGGGTTVGDLVLVQGADGMVRGVYEVMGEMIESIARARGARVPVPLQVGPNTTMRIPLDEAVAIADALSGHHHLIWGHYFSRWARAQGWRTEGIADRHTICRDERTIRVKVISPGDEVGMQTLAGYDCVALVGIEGGEVNIRVGKPQDLVVAVVSGEGLGFP